MMTRRLIEGSPVAIAIASGRRVDASRDLNTVAGKDNRPAEILPRQPAEGLGRAHWRRLPVSASRVERWREAYFAEAKAESSLARSGPTGRDQGQHGPQG